jgi:hypothetical protein
MVVENRGGALELETLPALSATANELGQVQSETWTFSPQAFEETLAKTRNLTVTRGSNTLPWLLHAHRHSEPAGEQPNLPCNQQCLYVRTKEE